MYKRYLKHFLAAFLVCLPTLLPAFVPSTKALGMGLVGVAYPQDAEAAAFNPGGLVWVGSRSDFGFTASHNYAKTRIRDNINPSFNRNYDATDKHFYYDFHGGWNHAICDGNASVGFQIYNNSLIYSKYPTPLPIFGTSNFRAGVWQEFAATTLSFKVHPCHSLGISINYVLQSMYAFGIENYAIDLLSLYPTRVTNKGTNYSHGVGYKIGYLGNFTKYITVGASYQPEIKMSKMQKYRGLLAGRGRLNIPAEYALGIAIHPVSCFDISFDYRKVKYSNIPALANPLIPNLTFAALGNANYKFGQNKGPGFGWKDKESYHLGAAYRVCDRLIVRGGYGRTNTWWGPTQTAVNMAGPETVENFLTLGLTCCGWCATELSLHYIYGFPHEVFGENSISALSGGGNADVRQRRHLFGIGFGKTF